MTNLIDKNSIHLTKRELFLALGFLILTPLLQYIPLIFEFAIRTPIHFTQTSFLAWQADISSLPPGRYYISVGRPQGACELKIDDRIISSTTGGIPEVRAQLILGAGFEVSPDRSRHPTMATVGCRNQSGFEPKLHHQPVLSNFPLGIALQSARIFTDLLMGPIFSLLLIFSILLTTPKLDRSLQISRPFLIFGIISLFYAISLAQMGSLFLTGLTFSILHIVLRNLFSAGFIYLCSSYSRSRTQLLIFHVLTITGTIVVGTFFSSHLYEYYLVQYITFPISTLVVTVDLARGSRRSVVGGALLPLAAAWTALQFLDFANMIFFGGPFVGPAFIALVTIAIANIRYKELLRLEIVNQRATAETEKAREISQLSAQIAHDIRSPLALLKVIARDQSLSDEIRKLLVAASDRIRGIADVLLETNRRSLDTVQNDGRTPLSSEPMENCNLRDLVSIMQREKQSLSTRIQVHFDLGKNESYHSNIQPREFLRVISNLIDNAVESIAEDGNVFVSLDEDGEQIRLTVRDEGRGIPKDVMPRLFHRGASFGKPNGNGLGLFHAKAAVESWGGSIVIRSELGNGTECSITLPSAELPVKE